MIDSNRKDLFWAPLVSILILFLSSLPTWMGYQAETKELRFRGTYYDSQDYAVHLATMEAGRHGEWAYRFRFTTEPHNAVYFKLFYIVLGHFSKWLGLDSTFTYQLARWMLGFIALLILDRLMRQIFPELFWARAAFLLAALGSGLGWLQLIFNWTSTRITPIDFWLLDDYVFFSLSVFPHYAFVTIGMCLALSLWLDFLKSPAWIKVAGIAFTSTLVQFVNPIAFATVDVSLFGAALFVWWNMKRIRREDVLALTALAISQIPLLTYNYLVLSKDPVWSQFTGQNQTLSPPPDYYLWGFALFWPFAIAGIVVAVRTKSSPLGAAVLWITSAFVLAYAPVYIQRRFLQNITIPLAILATTGLMKIFELSSARSSGLKRWRFSVVVLFVFLASISSLELALGQGVFLQTHPERLYYPASIDEAVDWFRNHAQYNDFVLAAEQTSQVLAQNAGVRAYFGHEMETLDFRTKQLNVQAFFQGGLPKLASSPVKWIVYGPFEKEISPSFKAPNNLELVYDIPDLQIYQVK